MKPAALMVVTADQRHSRTSSDRVPEALRALHDLPGLVLPFERTAGDEIQGLLSSATGVVDAVEALSQLKDWRIGLGLGRVDRPLPDSTRAARGPAYLSAREAVERASTVPAQLRLVDDGDPRVRAEAAETVLWLLRALWSRRTEQGWEVVELLERHASAADVAAELRISPSAVSQRAARAHVTEANRGRQLAVSLLVAAGMEP